MPVDVTHIEFEVWSCGREEWEPAVLHLLDVDQLTDGHLKHVGNVAYMCYRDPLGRWLRTTA